MITARNAALWLLCLLVAAAAGCTWTETHREYPRSAFSDSQPHAHHPPAPNH